jgi:hypothetical protein
MASTNSMAIMQWVLATTAFAFKTRRLRPVHQVWLAPLVILLVAIALHLLVVLFGYQLEADWL